MLHVVLCLFVCFGISMYMWWCRCLFSFFSDPLRQRIHARRHSGGFHPPLPHGGCVGPRSRGGIPPLRAGKRGADYDDPPGTCAHSFCNGDPGTPLPRAAAAGGRSSALSMWPHRGGCCAAAPAAASARPRGWVGWLRARRWRVAVPAAAAAAAAAVASASRRPPPRAGGGRRLSSPVGRPWCRCTPATPAVTRLRRRGAGCMAW